MADSEERRYSQILCMYMKYLPGIMAWKSGGCEWEADGKFQHKVGKEGRYGRSGQTGEGGTSPLGGKEEICTEQRYSCSKKGGITGKLPIPK